MSSFVGIVRWSDDRPHSPRDGERLAAALSSPGHPRPTILSAPPAHLGFCQHIVTEEDRRERQPATQGAVVSLFDGRLDDREGLSSRLAPCPPTLPDGDLALAAFRRWGADAAGEMLGEFAWAVWDGAARQVVLARDTSVSRALYVYRDERIVAFATGLRALFSLPEVPREPDDEGLAEFIALYPGQGERTVYRNVLRVVPGTTAIIDRRGIRRLQNWRPRPVQVPRDPTACAEAAHEIFGRAVKSRLRAIGPAALALSGGLDSSIIAAEAAWQRDPDPVLGYVLVPPAGVPLAVPQGWAADQRPQVEALARRHPNLRLEFLDPPVDPIDLDPTALFAGLHHPIALSPNIGWLLAAWRAARGAGARVMLTGDDGEMSLTHFGSLRAVARQGDIGHALREIWRFRRRQGGGLLGLLDQTFLDGRLSRLRDRERAAWPGDWRRFTPIHPDLAEAAGIREKLLAENFPGGLLYRAPGYAATLEMYLRRRAPTVDTVAAMRHLSGVDHTCPFGDRRVLEFCLSLPEAMFIRDGQHRWLARAAFRDLLPAEIRDDRGKGAQNPEWFHRLTLHRPALQEQVARIATSPLANRALDIPRLKALLDRWPATAEEAEAAGPAYRSILARGLHAGAFLRWIDPDNGA